MLEAAPAPAAPLAVAANDLVAAAREADTDKVFDAWSIGCPMSCHVRLEVDGDGRWHVVNTVTLEKVALPLNDEADYDFNHVEHGKDAGLYVISTDGTFKIRVDECFTLKLTLSDDAFVCTVDRASGDLQKLLPDKFVVDALYVPFLVGDQRIRLKVFVTRWSNPTIFWETRRLWPLFGVACDGMPKFVTQAWRNWAKFVTPYGEPFMLMRAAHNPRSNNPQHYLRASEQASISTAGILLLLGTRYTSGRPVASRKDVPAIVDKWIMPAFLGSSYDITFVFCPTTHTLIHTPPSRGRH